MFEKVKAMQLVAWLVMIILFYGGFLLEFGNIGSLFLLPLQFSNEKKSQVFLYITIPLTIHTYSILCGVGKSMQEAGFFFICNCF